MTSAKKKTHPKTAAAKAKPATHSHPVESVPAAPALPWWRTLSMEGVVRGIVLFFAATLPLYYDLAVPEVSGDIRWAATEFFAGVCVLLLVSNALVKGRGKLSLHWPTLLWIALGLAIWVAISLIDALNWTRGVVLIKALYCQLILMVVVYHVATPGFGRKLLWALILPLFITSIVGMWQFQGLNDASFHAAMDSSWIFCWFKPVIWVLDGMAGTVADWMGWGERKLGIVGLATNYFMQSAVPGSTFANKNLAGSWTGMMLPIALYLLLTAKRWPAQALASLLLGLGTVFLVYSRARASWVALFAALITLAALVILVPAWRKAVWRHLDMSHLWWMLLPVAMVFHWGADTSPVAGAYAVDRSPGEQVAALAGQSWNEIGGRLAYNLNSLAIVKDYWFNGVGLGSFYTIYPPYYNALVVTPTNSYNVMARPQRTHTDMMQAFDETGIPGGILYVGLFVTGIAMAMRLAGKRAGGLGGYIVGAGMLSMVMGLTVLLEYKQMLSLPEPWNLIFYVILGAAILGLLAGAARCYWFVRKETAPADDVQLMGLMAGISLLTISINALMDFPMQLPTAPAAAALLLGLICALYARQTPSIKVGPKAAIITGRAGPAALLVVLAFSWGWAMYDAYNFRAGNVLLKAAMIRIFSGVNDETTVAILEKAYDVYPYDQRILEHMGVAYANYSGTVPISLDERQAKLEWVLKSDPWGANHLINLAGIYLQKAQLATQAGHQDEAMRNLAKAEDCFTKLKKVADFSHFTWGIGGMIRLMEGRTDDAIWMFQRALAIEPTYEPAVAGLQQAVSRSSVKPIMVKDNMLGQ